MYLPIHFLLFSIIPLTRGIFLILGKKPTFLLLSKRKTNPCQATTDHHLSCAKPLQSGFVLGDSTTFQLLHTYHMSCETVDNGMEIWTIFCDISKAFDRGWHKGLLHALRGIDCSGKVLAWFSSYLSGCRQRVVLKGKFSKWVEVLAGVPQGSILGPAITQIVFDI